MRRILLEVRTATPIAVIRRVVAPRELSGAVRAGCGTVWSALRAQGVKGGRNVAVYWDQSIMLDAGVECVADIIEGRDVIRSATPEGLVAAVRHLGPYQSLDTAHEFLNDWVRANGHRRLGPRWETYEHWQPAWEADPSKIETEVAYLVEPA